MISFIWFIIWKSSKLNPNYFATYFLLLFNILPLFLTILIDNTQTLSSNKLALHIVSSGKLFSFEHIVKIYYSYSLALSLSFKIIE